MVEKFGCDLLHLRDSRIHVKNTLRKQVPGFGLDRKQPAGIERTNALRCGMRRRHLSDRRGAGAQSATSKRAPDGAGLSPTEKPCKAQIDLTKLSPRPLPGPARLRSSR